MEFAGRTALVTGGSSGIGLEIALGLAAGGARVLLPVRDRARGDGALVRIRERLPQAGVELLDLDLARLETVHGLATALANRPIDLLVLNAGVVTVGSPGRQLTPDGFELNFQTNYLGHAALVRDLLPRLRQHGSRLVVQCSLAAAHVQLDWDDLQGERSFHAFRAYAASKLALGLFGMEVARRSSASGWGVSVQLCHPGVTPGSSIAPAIRAMLPGELVHWASQHLGNSPAEAARTALAAATTDADDVRLFAPAGHLGLTGRPVARAPFPSLCDPDAAAHLWQVTATLLG
ncbi:MAG: SDR family NAD(P)-dependent oxidoreductase [Propionicimonas sp.]|uniref:SDR family NAD(P)-dependent oxidoreductase n=1 Tax=Propionicimonas sp. TaxID=1955623 RepID=UPI002B21CE96|nr:SDR family NAD(P)-dependent oxidoreductase [Propionicimonas sp.]MEA4944576.1 SDR family NAD(P)-dependent oxidoreductase [Propionicimonas sp.]